MTENAVVVKNLTFQYPGTDAPLLRNVGFELARGEILGIMGRTGSGKTTLAMTLNGLIPSMTGGTLSGEISVDGKNTADHSVAEMAESIGYVFQEPESQISQMTVEEEIAFGLGNLGVPCSEMPGRIREALATVGLPGYEKRSPLALSGGQQQRLAIASVLAMKPRIFVLDEPTSMLDPVGKNEVYEVLEALKKEKLTGIIIDHEAERIARYCDKVLILHAGEILMLDTPERVFSRYETLKDIGLHVPQVSELTSCLNRDAGQRLSIPTTLEEAFRVYRPLEKGAD